MEQTPEYRLRDRSPIRKKRIWRIFDRNARAEMGRMDLPFFLLTMVLVVVGLIMMFSASYARAFQEKGNAAYYLVRQGIFALVGAAALLFISTWDYQAWRGLSVLVLPAAIVLLILVLFIGVGEEVGSTRWINLGFTTFQPSEAAKFAVVVTFATLIAAFRDKMETFRYGVIPFALILGVIALLLLKQPHLSATIIICGVGAAMMFQGGTRFRWFLLLAVVAWVAWTYLTAKGYTARRLSAWRDPFADPSDSGYQIVQSLYAIGSAGLFGLGFGKSRQKYLYLPEEHNDYIFPIICEELGFVGATLIILLFALLIVRGYWIALHAKDRFGSLLAGGFTTLLAIQVFLNIAVVTNFLPSTGISLPFFSYGGTALVIQLIEMGVILSVSRDGRHNLS